MPNQNDTIQVDPGKSVTLWLMQKLAPPGLQKKAQESEYGVIPVVLSAPEAQQPVVVQSDIEPVSAPELVNKFTEVGKDVGEDVGSDVGFEVGEGVGFDVGFKLGEDVGFDVGDVVIQVTPYVSTERLLI